jgi:hypothetical protein
VIAIDGALDVSLDGVPARLVAEGRRLRLEVHHPVRLLRRLSLRSLVRLAARLDRLGLTLHVVTRRRTVLLLGSGVQSRVGRILFRSSLVGFRG